MRTFLANDVEARYNDCEELRQELTQVLADLSASYSEIERQRLSVVNRQVEFTWFLVFSLGEFLASTRS